MNEKDITPGTELSKKKRGAQPENQNARTHGFYSHVLTTEQQESMASAEKILTLDPEIALVRLKILSILANDPDNHAAMLLAVSMLTRMVMSNNELRLKCEQEKADKQQEETRWGYSATWKAVALE